MSVAAVRTPILRLSTGPLKGKAFEVGATLRVGRHPFNELSLGDPGLSRYHCWIMVKDGAPCVEDLASANGTFVNGERVRTRRTLKVGDVIRVGSTELVLSEAA
jgi:pSer/pThr/pTyr-binding forkhead associated (FHA) protein